MATRRERVVLELEDRFTPGMARAAAQSAALSQALDRLDKGSVRAQRSVGDLDDDAGDLGRTARNTTRDIDRFSGRLSLLVDVATMLGPALVPIGAVAIPAITGLASAAGFAAVGAGTMMAAFQGVGDALDAVNKAALEPTEANLEKARREMAKISPEARGLVRQLHSMIPELKALRDTAAAGFFPGLVDGLEALEGALPRVERILDAVSTELGDIARDAGESLASDRWAPFLDFIAREAPAALSDLAAAAGDTMHALAELWMAFDPLNDDFTRWIRKAADDFDRWASELSRTEGFREFVAYVREVGPQVGETLSALGNAFLQIVEAAAPLGGPTLRIIEALADAIAKIADSDLGTPLLALASLSSAVGIVGKLNTRLETALGSAGSLRRRFLGMNTLRFGALLGGLAAIDLGLKKIMDADINESELGRSLDALARGQVTGTIRDAVGDLDALSVAIDQATSSGFLGATSLRRGASELPWFVGDIASGGLKTTLENVEKIDAALANMAESGRQVEAAKIFDQITDAAKRNGVSVDQVKQAFKQYGIAVENLDPAIDANAQSMDRWRRKVEAARQREKALADQTAQMTTAAREQGQQWLEFGDNLDDAKVSLDKWIESLAQQAIDLENFTKNARTAADRGLRKGLIAALEEAGPAGARRMRELADATDEEIRRANAAWDRGRRALKAYVDFKVPPKTITINTRGYREAYLQLLRLRGMNINDKTFKITGVYGTSGSVYDSTNPIAAGRGRFAGGGYTGNMPASQPAGVVHGREFVFDAVSTARAGVQNLYAMQRALRGYKDGGYVAPAAATRALSSPSVTVGSPAVSVGGTRVQVFIDGREVRAIVREEQAADRRFAASTSGMRPE